MPRRAQALVAALAVTAGTAVVAAGAMGSTRPILEAPVPTGAPDANSRLACIAPTDATGLDAILTAAGSPMAGGGSLIVDSASGAGIDPRLLVAIAAHETMLGTYAPAAAIHNPFGLGPGIVFADEAGAIRYAVSTLAGYYLPEGRDTIAEIGAKWAPVGAKNDPAGLNQNWTDGVSRYYAALGGDPARKPLLAAQDASPSCNGGGGLGGDPLTPPYAPEPPSVGEGPPIVVVWGGNAPAVTGASTSQGADPATGLAASIRGFAFPVAVRGGGEARYGATACPPVGPCAVEVSTAPMSHVVAATDGRLLAGTASERAGGIAFWIVRPDGDRVGYGPLASYAPGIGHGAQVRLGQPLGQTTGRLGVAWTRKGTAINPYPLLSATRPPDPVPSQTS